MCARRENTKIPKDRTQAKRWGKGAWWREMNWGDLQKLQRLSLVSGRPLSPLFPTSCGKITTMRHGLALGGELQFCFCGARRDLARYRINMLPSRLLPAEFYHKVAWWGKSHTNKKWRRAVVETANAEERARRVPGGGDKGSRPNGTNRMEFRRHLLAGGAMRCGFHGTGRRLMRRRARKQHSIPRRISFPKQALESRQK